MSVENEQFIKLCEMLRPGYKPPNRKNIAGELLNKINDEVSLSAKEEFKKEQGPVVLMQDGWSNTKNDLIIAHSIHNGKKPHLLSVIDAGANKKTSEYCVSLAKEAITKIKETYNKEVTITWFDLDKWIG